VTAAESVIGVHPGTVPNAPMAGHRTTGERGGAAALPMGVYMSAWPRPQCSAGHQSSPTPPPTRPGGARPGHSRSLGSRHPDAAPARRTTSGRRGGQRGHDDRTSAAFTCLRQIRTLERLLQFSADPPKRDEGRRCASDVQQQAPAKHGAVDVGARTDARLFRRTTAGVQSASAVEEDVATHVRNVQVRGVGHEQDDDTDQQES